MEPVVQIPLVGESRFTFDRRFPHGRYRGPGGRFVSWETIRAVLDATLDSAEGDAQALSERLRAGEITLREWQAGLEAHIRASHTAAYALQRGGFRNMTTADFDALRRILFNPDATDDRSSWGEFQYLRRFAEQIAFGEQSLDGNIARRAKAYTRASRGTYHWAERRLMQERGFDEAARLRFAGDSCTTAEGDGREGCIELGSLDRQRLKWVPIDEVVMIGDAVCHSSCRCRLFYRNSSTRQIWPES